MCRYHKPNLRHNYKILTLSLTLLLDHLLCAALTATCDRSLSLVQHFQRHRSLFSLNHQTKSKPTKMDGAGDQQPSQPQVEFNDAISFINEVKVRITAPLLSSSMPRNHITISLLSKHANIGFHLVRVAWKRRVTANSSQFLTPIRMTRSPSRMCMLRSLFCSEIILNLWKASKGSFLSLLCKMSSINEMARKEIW
jgi:hypothetical protein